MPGYNYFNNPYQQYFPQNYQQNFQQQYPVQQTMMPSVTPSSYNIGPSQSSIIWVSGEREAQMYPVVPNNAVTLWSQAEPVVYLKQADATGKPTLKVYDLVERTESESTQDSKSGHAVNYATKDDLSAVVGVVKNFDEMLSGLKTDVDNMKSDMYGIAGKKKAPVKKAEADDE